MLFLWTLAPSLQLLSKASKIQFSTKITVVVFQKCSLCGFRMHIFLRAAQKSYCTKSKYVYVHARFSWFIPLKLDIWYYRHVALNVFYTLYSTCSTVLFIVTFPFSLSPISFYKVYNHSHFLAHKLCSTVINNA
jgi:hypothetical protein